MEINVKDTYDIYMKKTPNNYERKLEQMGRDSMFLERNIYHHEKSNLLELMNEFNTISVKKH